MCSQPRGPAPQAGCGTSRGYKGRLKAAGIVFGIVMLLTGCMEALRTGPTPVGLPPAALPTPTRVETLPPVVGDSPSPTLPGSRAPDPATAAPTVGSTPSAPATPLPTLALPPQPPPSLEERWRRQQLDRSVLEAPRLYATTGSELWWFDPQTQQHVILGRITGDFLVQAQFTLQGQGAQALEVPYQVNVSYGLTALSPALLDRIRAAGYSEWIETYVLLTPSVFPR